MSQDVDQNSKKNVAWATRSPRPFCLAPALQGVKSLLNHDQLTSRLLRPVPKSHGKKASVADWLASALALLSMVQNRGAREQERLGRCRGGAESVRELTSTRWRARLVDRALWQRLQRAQERKESVANTRSSWWQKKKLVVHGNPLAHGVAGLSCVVFAEPTSSVQQHTIA